MKKFLICVDSDGCVFDTMEIKWKECFIPAIIKCWHLQPIAKEVREEAQRINLYSSLRGINRFVGLIHLMDRLEQRDEITQKNFKLPNMEPLRNWVNGTTKLSTSNLKEAVESTDDPILKMALHWTMKVNEDIGEMVHGIPPFPNVVEVFTKAMDDADVWVVSSANQEALEKEWTEHGLMDYVNQLCGQEMGSKKECIKMAIQEGYLPAHIIMIGDAPGDLKAAKDNEVSFYPIVAGQEAESWKGFLHEGFDKFIEETYRDKLEQGYIQVFEKSLPVL